MPTERTASDAARRERLGAILLIVAAVLWSINGLFIRNLHNSGLSGWSIAGYRSLFACLFLTPFALRRRTPIRDPGWTVAAVLCFTAMCATFVIATTQTTVANAIILQYTAPAWVFLLSPWITREHATSRQFVALGFSLAGVVVIFAWQFDPTQGGLVLGLVSGVVFGVQTVVFRRVRALDPIILVWLACGGSAILLLAMERATGTATVAWPNLGWLLFMGVVQFALPYVLFSMGVGRLSAQKSVLLVLFEPLLSPVWVWIAVGESPHVSTIVGGALIFCSVIYVTILEMVRGRDRAASSGFV